MCMYNEVEGRGEIFLENNASVSEFCFHFRSTCNCRYSYRNNLSRSGGAFQLRTRQ